jgi:hypothetical protein
MYIHHQECSQGHSRPATCARFVPDLCQIIASEELQAQELDLREAERSWRVLEQPL